MAGGLLISHRRGRSQWREDRLRRCPLRGIAAVKLLRGRRTVTAGAVSLPLCGGRGEERLRGSFSAEPAGGKAGIPCGVASFNYLCAGTLPRAVPAAQGRAGASLRNSEARRWRQLGFRRAHRAAAAVYTGFRQKEPQEWSRSWFKTSPGRRSSFSQRPCERKRHRSSSRDLLFQRCPEM